jgi:hypothetical protein
MCDNLETEAYLYAVENKHSHSNQVAELVSHYTKDKEVIAAAILWDIMVQTDVQVESLYPLFGHRVTELIELVTDNEKESSGGDCLLAYHCEHVPKLPEDALLIKLAILASYENNQFNAHCIVTKLLCIRLITLDQAHKSLINLWCERVKLPLVI